LKIGIILPQTGQQAKRENVIQVAQKAEKERFDSLWVVVSNFIVENGPRILGKF
jgi:alkanesulfonate monooxygenase SsuD/methylene tetrahydromethanopterin reductase-like flavin-dependent oxidoreductase (luciferase family)